MLLTLFFFYRESDFRKPGFSLFDEAVGFAPAWVTTGVGSAVADVRAASEPLSGFHQVRGRRYPSIQV